jgi:GT2 family glycosyltransferase
MVQGLSVVIPNYNGRELLPHTLPTVFSALQNTGLPSEIIIVDDCSTDQSVTYIKQNFPQVILLNNVQNSGFSITVNKGVKASKYDLVLILNSDVKLEPGYFKEQLKYFDHPDTFGVMGRIIGWEDEKIQDGAKYPYFHGVKIKTSGNYLLKKEEEMKQGLYSMYLSGANALVNKGIYLALGGLDELFAPYYVEDYELSLRAWRLGFKCYYDHQSVCRHRTSSTIKSKSRKNQVEKIYNRNKMYLHAIHLARPQRYLYFLQLVPELIARFITGRWAYLGSLGLFIGSYGKLRKSRNRLHLLAEGKKLLSIREVANKILDAVRDKELIRF